MLSKSAAKAFFLVGTGVCAGAFLLLTLDTFKRIPAQTHSQNITPAVAHGKHLWDSNNCMGCHTIFGEGAYYAPELTKVYERRGETFIRSMLTDPEAMYPGERKMRKYNFSDKDRNDLIAFLKWVGEVDLNGFPAKTSLGAGAATSGTQLAGRPAIFGQICVACHTLGGAGGNIGPVLDGVGSRRTKEYITTWLKDPNAVKPGTKMPKLPLSDADIEALSTYLSQQKGNNS